MTLLLIGTLASDAEAADRSWKGANGEKVFLVRGMLGHGFDVVRSREIGASILAWGFDDKDFSEIKPA